VSGDYPVLDRDNQILATDFRRALDDSTRGFATSIDAGDMVRAEKWAQIAFGLLDLVEVFQDA